MSYKTCSCGEDFLCHEDYLAKTTDCGTMEFEDEVFVLRNCKKCLSTLTTEDTKDSICIENP